MNVSDIGYILSACITGGLAFAGVVWQTRKVHREMHTNNGKRLGEYIELISANVNSLREDFKAHTKQDADNFKTVQDQISGLKKGE